jgi:hypothetical protein
MSSNESEIYDKLLKQNYFFSDKYYIQEDGLAMGTPSSTFL